MSVKLPILISQRLHVGDDNDFVEDGWIRQQHFANGQYEERNLAHLNADQILFYKCSFAESDWHGAHLIDIRFEQCDLSNVDLTKASLHRVHFVNCKGVGLSFYRAHLRHVTFEDCQFDYMNGAQMNVEHWHVDHCSLQRADLCELKGKTWTFHDVRLDGAQLYDTKLADFDFSHCHFETIGLNARDLPGCTIAPEQAVSFIQAFGVKVKED